MAPRLSPLLPTSFLILLLFFLIFFTTTSTVKRDFLIHLTTFPGRSQTQGLDKAKLLFSLLNCIIFLSVSNLAQNSLLYLELFKNPQSFLVYIKKFNFKFSLWFVPPLWMQNYEPHHLEDPTGLTHLHITPPHPSSQSAQHITGDQSLLFKEWMIITQYKRIKLEFI